MRNGTWDPIFGLETSVDRRFQQMEARFARLEARLAQRDQRERDARMSRQFGWLVGLLVTFIVTALTTLGVITSLI